MACYGCATNFSIFTKEHSCPNCRFSFCNKCLKAKVNVDDKNQKVCSACFKKLTTESDTAASQHDFDPPALLLKRLESLENPAKPPITIFKEKGKLSSLKAGLGPEDRQIYDRLKKLREDRKIESLPSETEIKRRLLVLKGLNQENIEDKPQLLKSQRKTEQEEVNDLLMEYMSETMIDGNASQTREKSLKDLESRVKNLHMSENVQPHELRGGCYESGDVDSVSKRLIAGAIAEAEIEKKWEASVSQSESDEDMSIDMEEESELPWCIICNEDAVLRCLGCDRSLYCQTCFKEGHDFFEMKDHKTINVQSEETS